MCNPAMKLIELCRFLKCYVYGLLGTFVGLVEDCGLLKWRTAKLCACPAAVSGNRLTYCTG